MRLFTTVFFLFMGYGLLGQNTNSEKLYEKALANYRDQQLEVAYGQVNELLSKKPTAKAAYLSGLIHEAMNKDLRAVSDYELAVRLDPEYDEAIFQKALIYLKYDDPGQALKDFNFLINNGSFNETRGVYFQIDQYGQQQNRVMTLSNLKAQLHFYRGQAHQELGSVNKAITDYQMASEIHPEADYYISVGILYADQNQLEVAVDQFRKAIELNYFSQLAWYNWALIDPELEIPPEIISSGVFVPSLQLLAAKAMEQENHELARKYFDLILINEKSSALTYVNRARVLLKLNDYRGARADLKKARDLAPKRVEALYLIGNSYFFEENFTQAIAYYDQYLTVNPQNAMVWYNGGMSYLALEQREDGCHYLSKAISLGMDQADIAATQYCQ